MRDERACDPGEEGGWFRWAVAAVVAPLLLLAGCDGAVEKLDALEQGLPLMRRAAERAAAGRIEEAVELYEEVLRRNPDAARGHLDLAILLHDHEKDYVGAIYHYRRYVQLRPETEKDDMIGNRIRLALQALAAQVLPPDRKVATRIEALESENRELREAVKRLEAEVRASEGRAAEHQGAELRTSEPRRAEDGKPRVYRVREGDTLSSIASQFYGDASKWKEIHEANRVVLGDTDVVKAGQTLVIP